MIKFIKCDKANHICDKIQYKEAKLTERILLKVHLMLCTLCRDYTSKNIKLSRSIENANIRVIHSDKKIILKALIQNEILKNKA